MAKYMKKMPMLLSLLALSANAEALRDPTMPPTQFMQAAAPGTQAASAPVLQSVMLSRQQKAAIINGQLVPLGHQFEQSVLVKLTENAAVLRAPDGTLNTLSMQFPVQKSRCSLSGKMEM